MFEIVDKYQELMQNIPSLIKESKFKKEYIISSLNLTRSTFYNKLRNFNFSPEELRRLGEILFPEEARNYALKKSLERGTTDISKGNIKSHEDVISGFRRQYGD